MSDTNERIAKYKEIMIGKAHSAQIADIIIKKLVELGFSTLPRQQSITEQPRAACSITPQPLPTLL